MPGQVAKVSSTPNGGMAITFNVSPSWAEKAAGMVKYIGVSMSMELRKYYGVD